MSVPMSNRGLALAAMFVGLTVFPPAWADTAGSGGVAWHHEMRARAMSDMARIMDEMAKRMEAGKLDVSEHKRMSTRMIRMSEMMRLMSEWETNPAMVEPGDKESMMRMRREMDEMLREMAASATSPGRAVR
jgi:hypothetical protein